MTYTINESGIAGISSLKKKIRSFGTVRFPIILIVVFLACWDSWNENGIVNFEQIGFSVSMGIVFLTVFVLTPLKAAKLILKSTITGITIEGDKGFFKLPAIAGEDAGEISFKLQDLKIIPLPKVGTAALKGKEHIIFYASGCKLYFIDEYWDGSELILDKLDIKERGQSKIVKSSAENISHGLYAQEREVKDQLFYGCPIRIALLLFMIIAGGVASNMTFWAILTASVVIGFSFSALIAYPSIRTAKLLNHIVNKVEFRDNYCYLYCRNIFSREVYYKVYQLTDISVGEWEIYQEKFFKENKFMVLDAGNDKYYLMGEVLTGNKLVFGSKS